MEPQKPKSEKKQHLQQQNNQITQEKQDTFAKICQYLNEYKVQYEIMEHQPTRTSSQAANIRKTPLEWGSKTMLVKGAQQGQNFLLIYRANMKLSWKKIRKIPKIGRKAQMATEQDVLKLGVKPGGVPPFPHLIGVKGIMDKKFMQIEDMAFNAGHKCKSITMKSKFYPLEQVQMQDFTQD